MSKIFRILLSILAWRSRIFWILLSILTWRSKIIWIYRFFRIRRAMCTYPGGGCPCVVGFQLMTVWIYRGQRSVVMAVWVFDCECVVVFELMTVWISRAEACSYGSSVFGRLLNHTHEQYGLEIRIGFEIGFSTLIFIFRIQVWVFRYWFYFSDLSLGFWTLILDFSDFTAGGQLFVSIGFFISVLGVI